MRAVEKFYLRKHIDDARVEGIVEYLRDFGQGKATVERIEREVVLYVYNRSDVALVKQQFADLIDAEADLTQ